MKKLKQFNSLILTLALKQIFTLLLTIVLIGALAGCGETGRQEPAAPSDPSQASGQTNAETGDIPVVIVPPEDFVLINGGTFQMGSPESETWRIEDETAHTVTLGDYYISRYEVIYFCNIRVKQGIR